jgi:serine/threonine protein kinase/Flp pilus assembly protein TadD
MVGRQISHYQIIERLGHGGMGIVYKAQDLKLDRFVAIKVLPDTGVADEETKARFIQEAKAASAIDHPNIGSIFEIDETGHGELFIVMAYYEGETLREKIARGPLPVAETVDYITQIARGISRAHDKHILHRDLKPANVIVTNDRLLKIIDFGLAKLMGGMKLTRTGSSLGTVAYMAPEQLRAEDLSPAADVWSLGVMFYECLTGKLPFRGDFEAALLYSISNEDPIPIGTLRQDVPEGIQETVLAMLHKDPAVRLATMDEVVAALEGRQPTRSSEPRNEQPKSDAVDRRSAGVIKAASRKVVWIASTVIALAVVLFFMLRPGPSHSTAVSAALTKSIAIFPIEGLDGDDEKVTLDGIAAELRKSIARYPSVLAVSNSSARYYHRKNLPDSVMFHELGVSYFLKGKMRRTAASLIFDFSLMSNGTSQPIWTKGYAIPRLELNQLVRRIIEDLQGQLDLPPISFASTDQTDRPQAYESYLHGLSARENVNEENLKIAREYFNDAVKQDSDFVPALIFLAEASMEEHLQGYNSSLDVLTVPEAICRRVLLLDSTQASAYAMIGMILDERGRRDEGIKYLEKALELNPYDVYSLTVMGEMYLIQLGEPTKGLIAYKKLHELEPENWLTSSNLGAAYAQSRDYQNAIESFRRAERLDSTQVSPSYNLAYAFERAMRYDSAEYHYKMTLSKDSTSLGAFTSLAGIYISMDRSPEAVLLLEKAMKNIPDNYELYYLDGVAHKKNNRGKQSSQILNEGLKMVDLDLRRNPNGAEALAYRGLFAARLGDRDLARITANKVLDLDSTHEESLLKIAAIFAILNDRDAMLHWFGRAKEMNKVEYDEGWLHTAVDFEAFSRDPALLALVRM